MQKRKNLKSSLSLSEEIEQEENRLKKLFPDGIKNNEVEKLNRWNKESKELNNLLRLKLKIKIKQAFRKGKGFSLFGEILNSEKRLKSELRQFENFYNKNLAKEPPELFSDYCRLRPWGNNSSDRKALWIYYLNSLEGGYPFYKQMSKSPEWEREQTYLRFDEYEKKKGNRKPVPLETIRLIDSAWEEWEKQNR